VPAVTCAFTGNTAAGGTGHVNGSGFGGALFNLDGTVTLTGATLSGNTASDGSAVYNLAYGSSPTGAAQTARLIAVNSGLSSTNLVNNQDTSKNAGDKALAITITSSFLYDGLPHSITGTARGTADVSSDLTFSGTAHTNAGTYGNASWTFHDATHTYPDASGTATESIAPRPITITAGNQSKTYGDALSLGTSAFSVGGTMATGEAVTSGTLTSATGPAASTPAPLGTYPG